MGKNDSFFSLNVHFLFFLHQRLNVLPGVLELKKLVKFGSCLYKDSQEHERQAWKHFKQHFFQHFTGYLA